MKPKTRIGYNINANAVADVDYLLGHLVRLRPTVVLVMDGSWLADEIHRALDGEVIVIDRGYSAYEGGEWYRRTPEDFVRRWDEIGLHHIVKSDTNEPGWGADTPLWLYVERGVRLAELAADHGHTVAMGNFSVGTPGDADVSSGAMDSWLQAVIENGHYLAVHEYAACALPWGWGQLPASDLLDREKVQPERWPDPALLADFDGIDMPPFYHLLRSERLTRRARSLGLDTPRIVLTEAFWDYTGDIRDVLEELGRRYGMDEHMNDMRGHQSLARLWAWYWPQWTFEQAAFEQLKYVDALYPDNYLGFAMFSWTEDDKWKAYNFAHDRGLHQMLEGYTSPVGEPTPDPEPEPVPPPDWRTVYASAKSRAGANIRDAATLDGTAIGVLPHETVVVEIDLEEDRWQSADGYDWVPIRYGALEGWIASRVMVVGSEVVPDEPTPDPEPEPEPEPEPPVRYEIDLLGMTQFVDEETYVFLLAFFQRALEGVEQAKRWEE